MFRNHPGAWSPQWPRLLHHSVRKSSNHPARGPVHGILLRSGSFWCWDNQPPRQFPCLFFHRDNIRPVLPVGSKMLPHAYTLQFLPSFPIRSDSSERRHPSALRCGSLHLQYKFWALPLEFYGHPFLLASFDRSDSRFPDNSHNFPQSGDSLRQDRSQSQKTRRSRTTHCINTEKCVPALLHSESCKVPGDPVSAPCLQHLPAWSAAPSSHRMQVQAPEIHPRADIA